MKTRERLHTGDPRRAVQLWPWHEAPFRYRKLPHPKGHRELIAFVPAHLECTIEWLEKDPERVVMHDVKGGVVYMLTS